MLFVGKFATYLSIYFVIITSSDRRGDVMIIKVLDKEDTGKNIKRICDATDYLRTMKNTKYNDGEKAVIVIDDVRQKSLVVGISLLSLYLPQSGSHKLLNYAIIHNNRKFTKRAFFIY